MQPPINVIASIIAMIKHQLFQFDFSICVLAGQIRISYLCHSYIHIEDVC